MGKKVKTISTFIPILRHLLPLGRGEACLPLDWDQEISIKMHPIFKRLSIRNKDPGMGSIEFLEVGLCFARFYTYRVDPTRYIDGIKKNGGKKAIPSQKLFEGF